MKYRICTPYSKCTMCMLKIKTPMRTATCTTYPERRTRQRTKMRRDLLGRSENRSTFQITHITMGGGNENNRIKANSRIRLMKNFRNLT